MVWNIREMSDVRLSIYAAPTRKLILIIIIKNYSYKTRIVFLRLFNMYHW